MDGFQKIYQNNTKNEKESMEKEKKKKLFQPLCLSFLPFSSQCFGVMVLSQSQIVCSYCLIVVILFSCCSVLVTSSSLPFPFTILFCVIIQPDVMRVCETSTIGDMLVCTV